jgi:small subunit ribosomal protein S6
MNPATPFYGARKRAAWLKGQGQPVNRERVLRLTRPVPLLFSISSLWYNSLKFAKEIDVPRKKKEQVVGDKKLQDYELVFILNPVMEEEALENRINSISEFITTREGIISDVSKWGKKKLAYPIKQFIEGNYILAKFQMKPGQAKELEANLKISEEVIRHLLIKAGA